MNDKLAAFDESARLAQVVNIRNSQPPVEDGYMDSLTMPKINYKQYAETRASEADNIKSVSSFYNEMLNEINKVEGVQGATLPWTSTHDKLRFRPSEVTMWQGFNGHKKSMVLGYASLGFIEQNQPVCIASMEMKPSKTLGRMLKQAVGTKEPTEKALDIFKSHYENKLWMYDKQGTIDTETLYGVIYYAADKLNCKHFIIDSMMRIVNGEDDYNAQKNFVTRLCDIALETNIHIHFVAHNRKGDEDKPAGRYGAKGSGSLSDNVHNAVEVWQRPVKDTDDGEMPDMYLICDKQREGEWEGSIGLWFLEESLQFANNKGQRTRTWIR